MPRNKLSDPERQARRVISQNLKKYSKGLTQKDLSNLTGIPASTLSGYFAERSTPNAGALQKIADALNVKKSDIDPRYKLTTEDKTKTNKITYEDLGLPYKGVVSDDVNDMYRAIAEAYAKKHNLPKRDD